MRCVALLLLLASCDDGCQINATHEVVVTGHQHDHVRIEINPIIPGTTVTVISIPIFLPTPWAHSPPTAEKSP